MCHVPWHVRAHGRNGCQYQGLFENQQRLVWLLQGKSYILWKYRASDAHLVTALSPALGQRNLLLPLTTMGVPISSGPAEIGWWMFCSHSSLVPTVLFWGRRRRVGKLLISRAVKTMLCISMKECQKKSCHAIHTHIHPQFSPGAKGAFLGLCCPLVSVSLLIL